MSKHPDSTIASPSPASEVHQLDNSAGTSTAHPVEKVLSQESTSSKTERRSVEEDGGAASPADGRTQAQIERDDKYLKGCESALPRLQSAHEARPAASGGARADLARSPRHSQARPRLHRHAPLRLPQCVQFSLSQGSSSEQGR